MYYLSLVVAAVIFLVRLPSMRSINIYFFLFLFSLFALTHARIHGPITNQSDLYNSGQTGRFSARVISRSSFSKIVSVRLRFTPFFFCLLVASNPACGTPFLAASNPARGTPSLAVLTRRPNGEPRRGARLLALPQVLPPPGRLSRSLDGILRHSKAQYTLVLLAPHF